MSRGRGRPCTRTARGRGRPVDVDVPWTRTPSGRGRCPREQYTRSVISDRAVADYTLCSAPSDRRDMDLDAERTWTARGRGRHVDVDVTWTWTSRGRGRPKKIADVDMPRTQIRHVRGLAAGAGVSSMGFLTRSACVWHMDHVYDNFTELYALEQRQ